MSAKYFLPLLLLLGAQQAHGALVSVEGRPCDGSPELSALEDAVGRLEGAELALRVTNSRLGAMPWLGLTGVRVRVEATLSLPGSEPVTTTLEEPGFGEDEPSACLDAQRAALAGVRWWVSPMTGPRATPARDRLTMVLHQVPRTSLLRKVAGFLAKDAGRFWLAEASYGRVVLDSDLPVGQGAGVARLLLGLRLPGYRVEARADEASVHVRFEPTSPADTPAEATAP